MLTVRQPFTKMPSRLANDPGCPAGGDRGEAGVFVREARKQPILSGQLIERASAAGHASYCERRTIVQAVSALGLDCPTGRSRGWPIGAAGAGAPLPAWRRCSGGDKMCAEFHNE
jgi:hypothetical protein